MRRRSPGPTLSAFSMIQFHRAHARRWLPVAGAALGWAWQRGGYTDCSFLSGSRIDFRICHCAERAQAQPNWAALSEAGQGISSSALGIASPLRGSQRQIVYNAHTCTCRRCKYPRPLTAGVFRRRARTADRADRSRRKPGDLAFLGDAQTYWWTLANADKVASRMPMVSFITSILSRCITLCR